MITKTTFSFLKDIAANNNRDWFLANKSRYETEKENVLNFVTNQIKLLSAIDPLIPADLSAKNCVMRIYRDIRFSKIKTPYKTNFGIGISAKGKSFNGAGYYLHIEPGKSFLAAGDWQPEAERLKAYRQEIDYNAADFHTILNEPAFKKFFNDLSDEDTLKTSPKGYEATHPDIRYLRLKSYIVTCDFKDEDFLKADVNQIMIDRYRAVYPFMEFLRNAIS